jgi:hypothetical protein
MAVEFEVTKEPEGTRVYFREAKKQNKNQVQSFCHYLMVCLKWVNI